jgi:hypothetical protein
MAESIVVVLYLYNTLLPEADTAITKDQIWAVVEDLHGASKAATLAAVRKAVGGGRFTTIQDAMTEWKAKLLAAVRNRH